VKLLLNTYIKENANESPQKRFDMLMTFCIIREGKEKC